MPVWFESEMKQRILIIASSKNIGLSFKRVLLALMIKKRGHDVIALSGKKSQYSNLPSLLQRAKIRHYIIDTVDHKDPGSLIKATCHLRRILKKEDEFDIIQGEGIAHLLKIHSSKVVSSKNSSKIVSCIGFLPESKMKLVLCSAALNRFSDAVVPLCDYTKRVLIANSLRPNKAVTIPIASPDLNWFDRAKKMRDVPLNNYNLTEDEGQMPTIFYGASHYPWKGFFYYLAAAAKVLKKHSARFVLGGDGPMRPVLQRLATKLGIKQNVIFTGWISSLHMPYVLHNIPNICVSTSLKEQFPAYVVECMAAQKPVVATKVAGVPEAVCDGVNGYLIQPGNVDQLTEALVDLIENPEKAMQMGIEGRKIVEHKFSMELAVSRLEETYRRLM